MKRDKNKSLIYLGVGLVVLLGAVALLANPFAKPQTDITGAVSSGHSASSAKLLVPSKKDAVTAISILQPKQTEFKLEKQDGKWLATQGDKKYAADQDKVDKLLEGLPGLMSESLASSNTDKVKDYGLDDDTAVKVGVFAGGDQPATTLFVGNSSAGAVSSFVKVGDEKDIWRAAINVKALVGFSFKDYRSKKPWSFDPQIVKKLTVRPVGGQPDEYNYDNGVWKTASGANANLNAIVKLLEDWSKATVSDFADDVTPGVTPVDAPTAPADGSTAPPSTSAAFKVGTVPNLTVETPEGTFSLTLGEKDGSLYYVADQNKLVYKISEPGIAFYRDLKFDELKIAAAEDAAKTGDAGAPGAAPGGAAPGMPAPKPGLPPAAPSTPPAPVPPAGGK